MICFIDFAITVAVFQSVKKFIDRFVAVCIHLKVGFQLTNESVFITTGKYRREIDVLCFF